MNTARWLLALALLAGSPAMAQEGTLPVLIEAPAAAYPAEALARGVEADVMLRVAVDATGRVTDAIVTVGAGQGFDEAALDAVRAFTFEPARDAAGEPAPAVIGYRYRFQLDAVPTRSAEGAVLDADLGEPVVGARVLAIGPEGQTRVATTDAEGRFAFADLAEGAWAVEVSAPGFSAEPGAFEARAGAVAALTLYATPEPTPSAGEDLVVEVRAPRRPPELTERALTQEEIRYLPGTGGDVVRVVQNLPGVARPPLNIGQLLIRGVAPEDSAYYVDGVRVPIVFHFSGLSTVVNGDSLEEVVFFPGNFGARYGNVLGGGVDLRFDPELPEASSGYASIDVYQGTLFHEQRLGERTALTVSGRRSWVDAILNPILNNGAASVRAPRYWDGQLRVLHDAGAAGTFDALLLMSDDRFSVVGGEDEEEGASAFRIGLITTFQKARLQWIRRSADGWRSETTLLAGPEGQEFVIGEDGEAFERAFAVGLRQELSRGLQGGGRLVIGFDGTVKREHLRYAVEAFGPTEDIVAWRINPAMYVEPTFVAGPARITPGVRFDPLVQTGDFSTVAVDPRLGARVDVTPAAELRASVGRYSQHPTARQLADLSPGDTLLPARSTQTSLGLSQRLGARFTLETVGFYNRLENLVVGREDRFRFFTGPPPLGPFDVDPFANDGTGDIFGAELQLRVDTERTTGWIAATFSRSLRVKRPDADQRLFEFDQPVVLTALASHELPKGWRVGGRVRYGSGNPYTPVVNRVYKLDDRTFIPVYGEPDSARLPGFFSLDLRIDKEWSWRHGLISTYVDVQNATNAQNPEVMSWTYDYSEADPVTSLPVLPVLGVRVDW